MALVVFDADVLIAFLGSDDAHHAEAVACVRRSLEPGTRRTICSVNYSEVLVGPLLARGAAGVETVDAMLARLAIETFTVDMALAKRAAAVRARTKLKLPDAYALATAIHAEKGGHESVRLESFDRKVRVAYNELHPLSP